MMMSSSSSSVNTHFLPAPACFSWFCGNPVPQQPFLAYAISLSSTANTCTFIHFVDSCLWLIWVIFFLFGICDFEAIWNKKEISCILIFYWKGLLLSFTLSTHVILPPQTFRNTNAIYSSCSEAHMTAAKRCKTAWWPKLPDPTEIKLQIFYLPCTTDLFVVLKF